MEVDRRLGLAPLILSIDTATRGGSVCVVRGDEIIASLAGDRAVSHSNSLLRDIDRTLGAAGISLSDIDLFAACAGPGSFTGLRIGLATIKALALTLARPCAGIPTLEAIAHSAGPSAATVALLPAGRGELFCQLLSVSHAGGTTSRDRPAHLPPEKMIDKYSALVDLKWAGEGAYLYRDEIARSAMQQGTELREEALASSGWVLARREENLAKSVALLAGQKFGLGKNDGPQTLQAIYVRPSDAELKNQWP